MNLARSGLCRQIPVDDTTLGVKVRKFLVSRNHFGNFLSPFKARNSICH